MASSGMLKVVCLMIMVVVILAPHASAEISCNTVYFRLYPCISYVRSGGEVPSACCDGLKFLLAGTKADRQSVCSCLKSVADYADLTYAATIPGKCGVNMPYAISPNIDCSTVN